MKKTRLCIALFLFSMQNTHAQWAHLFHKKITTDEAAYARRHNCFFFTKSDLPMFSQLLLSWNALRPKKGHFSFFVQARNAHTLKWGSWHRMFEWGKDLQRSHVTTSDGFSKYVHVRLETEAFQLADGFRIKVVGAKGTSLSLLKGLAITTVNMNAFKPEYVTRDLSQLSSVSVSNVPKISQISLNHPEHQRICSPVSCTMLSQFLTKNKVDPIHFAQRSFDKGLNSYGSWPFNMAHAFERSKGKAWFYNTRLNSFRDIHKQLKRGIPAIVSVRGTLAGAPRPYPHGHLLTVVGYDADAKEVICHDSAKEGHENVEQRYSLADFLRSWEASRRLTYWVEQV